MSETAAGRRAGDETREGSGIRSVVACVDASKFSSKVIPHAAAIARAFRAELTLLRILETPRSGVLPNDPLEWDVVRREAEERLKKAAEDASDASLHIKAEIFTGEPAEQVCRWVLDRRIDLTVVCTHGAGGAKDWSLGGTAQKVIGRAGSVLLVPSSLADVTVPTYQHILLPLDGSARAESALAIAMHLTTAQGAELVLGHVVPMPVLTEIGPLAADDIDLQERLLRRNERVATEYLDRIRARIASGGVRTRSLVIRDGDPRGCLAALIVAEKIDLVILSAQGRTGRSDEPIGSVASYLAAHATVPLLILRRDIPSRERISPTDDTPLRLPDHATP